jgi:very-short-patch-repair endonuclease
LCVTQYKIFYDEKNHKYKRYDFLLPEHNVLIEVDGDYWHGNPKLFRNPNKVQVNNMKNDMFKNDLAIKMGYRILRFWENEIYLNNFEENLIERIYENK